MGNGQCGLANGPLAQPALETKRTNPFRFNPASATLSIDKKARAGPKYQTLALCTFSKLLTRAMMVVREGRAHITTVTLLFPPSLVLPVGPHPVLQGKSDQPDSAASMDLQGSRQQGLEASQR